MELLLPPLLEEKLRADREFYLFCPLLGPQNRDQHLTQSRGKARPRVRQRRHSGQNLRRCSLSGLILHSQKLESRCLLKFCPGHLILPTLGPSPGSGK